MEKRLYKSTTNRVLCGVCGGIGEYFNIDPTIIRLLCLMLICGWGSGLLVYLIAAIIIPESPKQF
jgi:phage shock protein PspC (stress-responsive transcriptional regulator)